jgi:hypothetical protein
MIQQLAVEPELVAGNVDFYCLRCGYNLRGLVGVNKRCPECFCDNAVTEGKVPYEEIRRQIQRLESRPACCILCFVILILSVWSFCRSPNGGSPLAGFLSIWGWIFGASTFAESCGFDPRYRRLLVQYHVYGIAACLICVGIPLGCLVALRIGIENWFYRDSWIHVVPLLSAFGLMLWLVMTTGKSLWQRAGRDFEVLQYNYALERARERRRAEIRRQMHR